MIWGPVIILILFFLFTIAGLYGHGTLDCAIQQTRNRHLALYPQRRRQRLA